MTRIRLLLSIALIISFRAANVQAQDDVKEVKAKLTEINKKIEAAVLQGDYESLLAWYTDDIIIDHPLEPPVKGKNAVREQYKRNRKEGVKYHSFSGTIQDLWVCGDRVYERGTWGLSVTSNRQKQPVAAYGSYFQIWAKGGKESYRIQYLIFTLDFNPYDITR